MKDLVINSSDGYLNLKDLPYNCIFNKVITGCGGTTVALTNNEKYVIAVPTTELIVNKTKINTSGIGKPIIKGKQIEIFGLFGIFDYQTKKDLKEYVTKGGKKIMCTYDKLPKLQEYINTSEYRLLVDEYHRLLKDYSYRYRAIDGVLKSFKDYKSYCFMSATPINPDFKPSELDGITEYKAVWNDTDNIIVDLEYSNKPYVTTANLISSYKKDGGININGYISKTAYFFINSVTDIVKILENCKLNNDEVRIICADTEDNRKKLGKYSISNSNSPEKKFNFITSKSFEGADFESEDGLCFVISTASNPHTQASIDTDIPQIAGRIRTTSNPFRNTIIHIFNKSYKSLNLDVSYEEMKEATDKELEDANKLATLFNNTKDEGMRDILRKSINNHYIKFEDNEFIVNDKLPKLELYNYLVNQIIYKDGLSIRKAYNQNGILTTDLHYNKEDIDLGTIKKSRNKMTFKEAYKRAKLLLKTKEYPLELEQLLEMDLVRDAIYNLDESDIRKINYTKKGVRELLLTKDSRLNRDTKMVKLLLPNLKMGEFNSNDSIRLAISRAYTTLGINEKFKPAKIKNWFDAEEAFKKIDGKCVRGYNIIRAKIIFKN